MLKNRGSGWCHPAGKKDLKSRTAAGKVFWSKAESMRAWCLSVQIPGSDGPEPGVLICGGDSSSRSSSNNNSRRRRRREEREREE